MNILVVANHFAVASGRYILEALSSLGHAVRSVGPAQGAAIWGGLVASDQVWVPSEIRITSQGIAIGPDEWRPDAVIVADSDPQLLDWCQLLRRYGGPALPIVVWGVDNHVRSYRREWFDHYFLAHHQVSQMSWKDAGDMTWLPCAYDPVMCQPSTIAWQDRAFDVAMIGVLYPQRQAAVEALNQAGFKVIAGTGPIYERYAAIYQQTRLSLCFSAAGDAAIRLWETGAIGCGLISDRLGDSEALGIQGIAYFDSPDSLVATVRDALALPSMGVYAQTWATPQTWASRAKVVLDWLGGQEQL